jgi:hypothetical protein
MTVAVTAAGSFGSVDLSVTFLPLKLIFSRYWETPARCSRFLYQPLYEYVTLILPVLRKAEGTGAFLKTGRHKEMALVLSALGFISYQPDIGLVHQGSGLKGWPSDPCESF